MAQGAQDYEILAKSLNKRLFNPNADTDFRLAAAVREARRIGAFTVADVIVLGTDFLSGTPIRTGLLNSERNYYLAAYRN